MSLQNPALSSRATERQAQELLDEWLRRYFSGPLLAAIIPGSPGTITTQDDHGCVSGQTICLANIQGGVPDLNKPHVITVVDPMTLALDVNVTTAGDLPLPPAPEAQFTRPVFLPSGDVTFPVVDIYYNQTEIPAPADNPQIHVHFMDFTPKETWFANGNLATWERTILTPGSGVAVGQTTDGMIEESVHGKSARRLPGDDYRIRTDMAGLYEEVLNGADWNLLRFIPGATALRWARANDYVEQALILGNWDTQRTININNATWDGDKKLVTARAIIAFYVRVANQGEQNSRSEFLCRSTADGLKELFQSQSRGDLSSKGFRGLRIINGPTIVPTQGWQQRRLVIGCDFRYFLARQP